MVGKMARIIGLDSRYKLIFKHINKKNVLDFGPGDISERKLINFISKYSKSYCAIELDKKRTKNLKNKGFNIILGNAETKKLNKKFDTVIAGDLIEHLDNPGLFLKNCKKHMKKNSTLILNTPNAFSINRLLMGLILRGRLPQFEEHTFLFTEQLLKELLTRHNFKIKEVHYFNHKTGTIKNYIIRAFSKVSRYFSENILIVAK